jgi:histidyl-tRNA synthetase
MLPMPFKRYQISPSFRAEKPQKGRYREFLQADADIFGVESPYADAEVIALSMDVYKKIGFKDIRVLINDRNLLKGIPYEALVAIDKLKKIGVTKVLKEMEKSKISKTDAKKYLDKVKTVKPNETISTILSYLQKMDYDQNWYSFEPSVVRSFSYSTGPIWEIEIPGFLGGSVLGGERFDKLTENISGKKIPGTGFGLGFDRTLEAAEQFGLIPKLATNSKVLVTIFAPKLLETSIKAVKMLRNSGFNSELYPDPEVKLPKQLKYADKKGIPWAVIIGPNEAVKGEAVIKNLKSKKQETVPLAALVTWIK